jgi:hypothetical protein
MEGTGRMVIVGVGLNSQVGNIMSLIGTTEGGNDSKNKKKVKKTKTTKPSAKKVTLDSSKQSTHIEDETKSPATTNEEHPSWRQLQSTDNKSKETNQDNKEEPTKNGQGEMAQLVDDVEEEEERASAANDSKHRCK